MNKGKYVFAQVASFIEANDFIKCVNKYNGNYRVQYFTCWHQLMCLMFGQLCIIESLSDLITCLDTQKSKWYHLGVGISKNDLSNANIKRGWRIFADYFYILIAHARKICIDNADFNLDLEGNVYAVDASIDLCLEAFWWAKFKKHKKAIKLHTQLDLKTNIPSFIHITDGSVHDVNYLDVMEIKAKSTYF